MKPIVLFAALLAAAVPGLAPGQTSETPAAETASPPAAESQTPAPSTGPGRAVWARDFDEAKQLAKTQGKVVFVEFAKPKCGNCFRMDGLLYPSANFEMALLRAVPVKLNLDLAEPAKLARRYHVDDVPAVLVVSPGGALIFRMVGFQDDRSFYVHLHNSMKDWDSLNLQIVHEPETIGDAKAQLDLGKALFRRLDSDEAIPRFERAAALPKATPSLREEALAFLASAQMDLERFADARKTTEKLIRIGKDPGRREKAELFRAQITLAEGKRGEARREFQSFLSRHPSSGLRDQAKAYLQKLDAADEANPQ